MQIRNLFSKVVKLTQVNCGKWGGRTHQHHTIAPPIIDCCDVTAPSDVQGISMDTHVTEGQARATLEYLIFPCLFKAFPNRLGHEEVHFEILHQSLGRFSC